MLPLAVARSCSDDSARYAPDRTSVFVDDVMFSHNGPMGQNQARRCFRESPGGGISRSSDNVMFGRALEMLATGAKLLSRIAGLFESSDPRGLHAHSLQLDLI